MKLILQVKFFCISQKDYVKMKLLLNPFKHIDLWINFDQTSHEFLCLKLPFFLDVFLLKIC